jgi:hypothetical protein
LRSLALARISGAHLFQLIVETTVIFLTDDPGDGAAVARQADALPAPDCIDHISEVATGPSDG